MPSSSLENSQLKGEGVGIMEDLPHAVLYVSAKSKIKGKWSKKKKLFKLWSNIQATVMDFIPLLALYT